MPLYVHKDKVTGRVVEILREFSQYKESPTQEEALAAGFTPEEAAAAQWEKQLGTGVRVVHAAGWGPGRKGAW